MASIQAVAINWGDAAAFRPLTFCKSMPSPGDVGTNEQLDRKIIGDQI